MGFIAFQTSKMEAEIMRIVVRKEGASSVVNGVGQSFDLAFASRRLAIGVSSMPVVLNSSLPFLF